VYSITLQTNDQSVSSGEIIGRLQFAASSESDGGASQSIVGGLYGVAQSNFSSSANPNSLYFITSDNDSSPAFPRLEISYRGDFLPISGSYNQYDIGASNNRFDNIYSSGIDTYSMLLNSYVPSNTTNKLYNDNGTLKFNGSAIGGAGGGGLNDLIDDTSPQLGGNLDLDTYSITGIGGININNDVVASGELKIGGYQPSDLENPGYLSVGEVRIQQGAPPTYVSSYKLYDIVTDSTNHRVGINMHDGSVYSELAPENTLDVNGTFSCPTIVAQENGGWATDLGGYWFSSVKDLSVQLDPSVTNQQAGSPGLLIGEGAKNYATNSMVFATNYFTSKGDAQRVFHVIQYESTDASDHYLTADKSGSNYSSAFYVGLGTVLTFILHIAANNDTDDTAAGWIIKGCIKNSTGTPQIVGSLITENFADASMSSASVSVVPNGTFDRMNIKINGISGKTIRWVCSLDGVLSRF